MAASTGYIGRSADAMDTVIDSIYEQLTRAKSVQDKETIQKVKRFLDDLESKRADLVNHGAQRPQKRRRLGLEADHEATEPATAEPGSSVPSACEAHPPGPEREEPDSKKESGLKTNGSEPSKVQPDLESDMGPYEELDDDLVTESGSEVKPADPSAGRQDDEPREQYDPESDPQLDRSITQPSDWPMEPEEYERYSRQMIVPAITLPGQLRLRSARILVAGAGGLGCPAAMYLAGAGVGTIGIVDGDVVELSNLHRQIAHTTARIGAKKVDSLITSLKAINPLLTYRAHRTNLHSDNAADIIAKYDLVLDCTDRPASRYLISDLCVLLQKPLVSAAALKTDGQLMVLNCPPVPPGSLFGSPCYRCVWRSPPPPEISLSCGEAGILGPVVGVLGTLQALEAIKTIAAGRHLPTLTPESSEMADVRAPPPATRGWLMTADLSDLSAKPFRHIPTRKRADCIACGPRATVTLAAVRSGDVDYADFCGLNTIRLQSGTLAPPTKRIAAADYHALRKRETGTGKHHLLLDVRDAEHFSIGAMPGAVNVTYRNMCRWLAGYEPNKEGQEENAAGEEDAGSGGGASAMPWDMDEYAGKDIWVVCRTGKDSQDVIQKMMAKKMDLDGKREIGDIIGGVKAWKDEVDNMIPFV